MKRVKRVRHGRGQTVKHLSKRIGLKRLDSILGAFRGRFRRRQPRMRGPR